MDESYESTCCQDSGAEPLVRAASPNTLPGFAALCSGTPLWDAMASTIRINVSNEALLSTLRRAGYTITIASDGAEGLGRAKEQFYDIVVTDIVMPDKEGIETIIELRRNCPETKIIAMSGGGRVRADDYLMLAKKLGASATIAKPFSGTEFLRLLEKATMT